MDILFIIFPINFVLHESFYSIRNSKTRFCCHKAINPIKLHFKVNRFSSDIGYTAINSKYSIKCTERTLNLLERTTERNFSLPSNHASNFFFNL